MTGLTRSAGLLAGWMACAVISGCGSGNPETVPVHGRITLDGGAWPKPGMIIFTCVEPAPGFPKRPGKGFFDANGEFVLTTFAEGDGLMPGTYRAMVICGEDIKDMEDAGKSYVPAKFQSPARSGIELTVAPDSDPIEFVYDIPSK